MRYVPCSVIENHFTRSGVVENNSRLTSILQHVDRMFMDLRIKDEPLFSRQPFRSDLVFYDRNRAVFYAFQRKAVVPATVFGTYDQSGKSLKLPRSATDRNFGSKPYDPLSSFVIGLGAVTGITAYHADIFPYRPIDMRERLLVGIQYILH